MIRKPDLRIDTQFFDDNLNNFNIPQATKVTQSIDTQTFIKQGLNQDASEQLALVAIQTIQKIMSQRLYESFINCWNKLKYNNNGVFIRQDGTPFSHKGGHKRQSPLVQNIANEDESLVQDNIETRGIVRQKILLHKLSGSQLDWLEQQRKKVKSRQILKAKSIKKSNLGETHFERAKVLKQIVDKLKNGRSNATNLINQIDNRQQDEQLHYKLNRLERMMEDVHYSSLQKGYATQRKRSQKQTLYNSSSNYSQEIQIRLKKELSEIKKEMQKIRLENERILKEQQWKKSQVKKIAITKEEIVNQYQSLKEQINYLEAEKRKNQQNQLRMQQQLSYNSFNKQQYERQINLLSQRVNQTEKNKSILHRSNAQQDIPLQYSQQIHQNSSHYMQTGRPIVQHQPNQLNRQPRQIIPSEPNPFGYSTFATSQKQSQTINWQQNSIPVGTHLGIGNIEEQGRQAADDWACC